MRSQKDSAYTCSKLDLPVFTLYPSSAADLRTCSPPQKSAAFRSPPARAGITRADEWYKLG